MCCRAGSSEQARAFVLAATGVSSGKRQLEQVLAGGGGPGRFCRDPGRPREAAAQQPGPGGRAPPLAISADGEGVAMRPGGARRHGEAPAQRWGLSRTGWDGEKKAISRWPGPSWSSTSVRHPGPRNRSSPAPRRRPGRAAGGEPLVCLRHRGRPRRHHRQGLCRGRPPRPRSPRPWIALADGVVCSSMDPAQAAARGMTVTSCIDFISRAGYLRKTAWCFHPPATRPWRTG